MGERGSRQAKLTLPYPPSVNSYWRQYKGRSILSQEAREYQKEAILATLVGRVAPFGARTLAVTIRLFMPDRRPRDLDNACKALLDAMQKAHVYDNDSQIHDLRIVNCGVDKIDPRAMVTIDEMPLDPSGDA